MSTPELTGRVVWRGEPDYDQARLGCNYSTSKHKFPKVIVYCQCTKDVQNAVQWALTHKTPIRIRSGGHNHEGYSTGNETLLIDVSEMKQWQLDKAHHEATVQPGLNNFELYGQLFKEGFTHVGGVCSTVGVSGLILSGGMGPLLRRVGLSCDALISVEMVDAKGQILHASRDNEHSDLFWALCGSGGGSLGVITSMRIKVYPVQDVVWFNIGWDWHQPIDRVISAWQEFFGSEDRNWFSHLDVWSSAFPSAKLQKHPIKVLGFYYGALEEARKQLAPLLSIGKPLEVSIERVSWDKAIQKIEEATAVSPTDKPEYQSIGAFAMDRLPAEAIASVVRALKESPSPLLNVLLFSMGGATADREPVDSAYFYRRAKFFICYFNQWLTESNEEPCKAELESLRQSLLPYTVGNYVGNPDPNTADYLSEYFGANAARLKHVKQKYDHDNTFHFEQSIR